MSLKEKIRVIDVSRAKLTPSAVFRHPRDVVIDKELSFSDKVDILKQWAYDERELEVAEEENMPGKNSHNHLGEVMEALLELGVELD